MTGSQGIKKILGMSHVESTVFPFEPILRVRVSGPPKMQSFLTIVVKLYSYKDSDIKNIQKIKTFHNYFRPSRTSPILVL